MKIFLSALLCFVLVGCGKKSAEEAASDANGKIAEMNSISTQLASYGINIGGSGSTSLSLANWTQSEVNDARAKLNRYIQLANEVEEIGNRDDVFFAEQGKLSRFRDRARSYLSSLSGYESNAQQAAAEKSLQNKINSNVSEINKGMMNLKNRKIYVSHLLSSDDEKGAIALYTLELPAKTAEDLEADKALVQSTLNAVVENISEIAKISYSSEFYPQKSSLNNQHQKMKRQLEAYKALIEAQQKKLQEEESALGEASAAA